MGFKDAYYGPTDPNLSGVTTRRQISRSKLHDQGEILAILHDYVLRSEDIHLSAPGRRAVKKLQEEWPARRDTAVLPPEVNTRSGQNHGTCKD